MTFDSNKTSDVQYTLNTTSIKYHAAIIWYCDTSTLITTKMLQLIVWVVNKYFKAITTYSASCQFQDSKSHNQP